MKVSVGSLWLTLLTISLTIILFQFLKFSAFVPSSSKSLGSSMGSIEHQGYPPIFKESSKQLVSIIIHSAVLQRIFIHFDMHLCMHLLINLNQFLGEIFWPTSDQDVIIAELCLTSREFPTWLATPVSCMTSTVSAPSSSSTSATCPRPWSPTTSILTWCWPPNNPRPGEVTSIARSSSDCPELTTGMLSVVVLAMENKVWFDELSAIQVRDFPSNVEQTNLHNHMSQLQSLPSFPKNEIFVIVCYLRFVFSGQWTGWCVIFIECLFKVSVQAWLLKTWRLCGLPTFWDVMFPS